MYGKVGCATPKTYAEHLILPPIVEFLADLIKKQIDLHSGLDEAAAQYGKSVTEEALEAAIQGELASVQVGKQRIVDAIGLGVLTADEAAAKLTDLREQEQRLTVELAGIAEKTAILEEWQRALDVLKEQNERGITDRLYYMAKKMPVAFRQLLGLVFEPNSLRVRTDRGTGYTWVGYLDDYQLTTVMKELETPQEVPQEVSLSFSNDNLVQYW